MQTKQDVRQVRKDGMDHLKRIKAQVSEDDHRRLTKEVRMRIYIYIYMST